MAEGDLKWRYDAGAKIRSGIAVGSDGVIYFGTIWPAADKIVAVNPNGTLKWEYGTVNAIYSGIALSNDESVVYGGDLSGNLYAINTADGSLKWIYTGPDDIWSGIAVDGDDNIYFGDETGHLYSVLYNGTTRWIKEHGFGNEFDSQITLKNDSGYTVCWAYLLKFKLSDGSTIWTHPTGGQGTGVSISDDDIIYWGEWNNIKAVYPDGTLKWAYAINFAMTANAIGSDGRLWSVDLNGANTKIVVLNADGTFSWDYNIPDWVGSEYDTTGLSLDSNDIVFVGSQDNKLYAINSDGTFRWSYTTGGNVESGIAFSPAEDTVYFGSDDGYLYALEKFAPPSAKGGSSALLLFAKMLMG